MIDKKRDGSKTVIVRGKDICRRVAEDSRDKGGLREVFLHLAAMLHEMRENRWEEEGKKKKKRLSVWRFPHPCFPVVGVPQFIPLLLLLLSRLRAPCPADSSDHVNSSGVLFMKERREDMERTLAES